MYVWDFKRRHKAISYFNDISSISIQLRWLRCKQVEVLETWLRVGPWTSPRATLEVTIFEADLFIETRWVQIHRPRNCFEKIFLTTYRGDEWPIPLSWQEKLVLKLSSPTCCKVNEIVQVCWAMGGFVWQSRILSSELQLGLHVASDSQLEGLGATLRSILSLCCEMMDFPQAASSSAKMSIHQYLHFMDIQHPWISNHIGYFGNFRLINLWTNQGSRVSWHQNEYTHIFQPSEFGRFGTIQGKRSGDGMPGISSIASQMQVS